MAYRCVCKDCDTIGQWTVRSYAYGDDMSQHEGHNASVEHQIIGRVWESLGGLAPGLEDKL